MRKHQQRLRDCLSISALEEEPTRPVQPHRFSERGYSLFNLASRDRRNVFKRYIFLTAASWRACSCLNASSISASRRLFQSNTLPATLRCFASSINKNLSLVTRYPTYDDDGIDVIW